MILLDIKKFQIGWYNWHPNSLMDSLLLGEVWMTVEVCCISKHKQKEMWGIIIFFGFLKINVTPILFKF